ncbi:UDP-3-O-acyl-N-acetylglucosamine deacetylase [Francisella salimarina]
MQYTLANPVYISGKGLHTNRHNTIIISPAPANTGFVFCINGKTIPTNYSHVIDKPLCTCIAADEEHYIRTIEHLLAAMFCTRIDNAYIYSQTNEIPILDGSCNGFYQQLQLAGIQQNNSPVKKLIIKKTIEYRQGNRYIKVSPNDDFSVNLQIKPKCGYQNYNKTITPEILVADCIDSRTFGPLYKGILAKILTKFSKTPVAQGASTQNTILLTKKKSYVRNGLRYTDEHVRHRVMDLVGDLMLCGTRHISGHFETFSTSHAMNAKLLEKIFADQSNFEWQDET